MSQTNPTDAEAIKYAECFVLYGDKTRAFRVAFPDSEAKPAHQSTKASLLHNTTKVQQMINELRESSNAALKEEALYSVTDKKKWLIDIVMYGASEELMPQPKWKEEAGEDPEYRQRNPSSAVAAIKELNLMDGDYAPKRQEISLEQKTGVVEVPETKTEEDAESGYN